MKSLHIFVGLLVLALVDTTVARAQEKTNVSNADLAIRGLKVSDFPRWKKLATDVYSYEGTHSPDADGRVINTVSLMGASPENLIARPLSRQVDDPTTNGGPRSEMRTTRTVVPVN